MVPGDKWLTAPICLTCWESWIAAKGEPGRKATRLRHPEEKVCAFCGEKTNFGAFVREQASKAPFYVEAED